MDGTNDRTDIPKMVTLRQASEITGLSYDRLRKWCIDGTLPCINAGRKRMININILIDMLR